MPRRTGEAHGDRCAGPGGGVAALFDGVAQSTVAPSVRKERPEVVTEVRARDVVAKAMDVQAGFAARAGSVPTVATIRVPELAMWAQRTRA